MKLKIDTRIIAKLNPCKDRFDNWKKHYGRYGTIDALQFLELNKITRSDKLWVVLKLVPRDLLETFAIDCAVQSHAYADAAAACAAADAAAYVTYAAWAAACAAADAADAADAERERQLDVLAYLIKTYKKRGAK